MFTYTISDGKGGTSSTTLTITITGTNDAPTAVADVNSLTEGSGTTSVTVSGDLTPGTVGQDSDPDSGDILTVVGVGAGSNTPTGGVGSAVVGTYGSVTVGSNGSYSYVLDGSGKANALGVGQTAQEVFTYTISDGKGGTSSTTLTITITGTNDAPTAVADVNTITEGSGTTSVTVSGDLTPGTVGQDSDPDSGDILTA